MTQTHTHTPSHQRLQVMEGVAMPMECNLHAQCMRYVMQSYTIVRERRSPEELQRLLPREMYNQLEGAVIEAS